MTARRSLTAKERLPRLCACGDHALLPLTHGATAMIDACDMDLAAGRRWRADRRGNLLYAKAGAESTYLHRIIAAAMPGQVVDHRDGFTLDNRRQNLRVCTPSENTANTRRPRSARRTSRFRGVYWNAGRGKWHAQIGSGAEGCGTKYLGLFTSEEAAARAYDAAARERFGEFARLNFREAA